MKRAIVFVVLVLLAPVFACAQGWQLTPLKSPNPPSAACNNFNNDQIYWDDAASPWQEYVCSGGAWVQVGVGTGQSSSIWPSGMQVYLNNLHVNGGLAYIFGGGIPNAQTYGGAGGKGAYSNIAMNSIGLPACTACEWNYMIGFGAGLQLTTGYANDGIGDSFASSVTTGAGNAGVGDATCQAITTGIGNICVGASALTAETTGSSNVAVGLGALDAQTTASGVVAVGSAALANNNASYINALGFQAMLSNTTGTANNAFGTEALSKVTTASEDTAMGDGALLNTTAGQMSAFGAGAGAADTTGNLNVLVGYNAGSTGPTLGAQDVVIGGMAQTGATVSLAAQIGYGTNNYSDTFQFNTRQEFDDSGNFNVNLPVYSVGTPIASAPAIAPTRYITHVTGSAVITTIDPPSVTVNGGVFTGCLVLIPDSNWTTGASGNIALATNAVIGRALTECYDGAVWYPSY